MSHQLLELSLDHLPGGDGLELHRELLAGLLQQWVQSGQMSVVHGGEQVMQRVVAECEEHDVRVAADFHTISCRVEHVQAPVCVLPAVMMEYLF